MTAQELINEYEEAKGEFELFIKVNSSILERFQEVQHNILALETELKKAVKEERQEISGNRFIARFQIRHSAPIIDWHIEEIKKQPWASAVIQETVDPRSFEALAKIGKIEAPEHYKTEMPGKEILAVSIEEIKKEV
jgi:hypothetical protein